MTTPSPDNNPFSSQPAGEKVVDPAQDSLNSALRGGFMLLLGILGVLVVLYLYSGVFIVDQAKGESGLVTRFGKLQPYQGTGSAVFPNGTYVRWPDPFEEKFTISGSTQVLVIDSFCFKRSETDKLKKLSEVTFDQMMLTPGVDGAMLTADRNLSHGIWRIEYAVSDAEKLVTRVAEKFNPQKEKEDEPALNPILQRVAETVILRTVAGYTGEAVLYSETSIVAQEVKNRLDKAVGPTGLDFGIKIIKVVADVVEPKPVWQAYQNVSNAEQARNSKIKKAETDATKLLTETAGPNYKSIVEKIDAYAAAQRRNASDQELNTLKAAIDAELNNAGGEVAKLLEQAKGDASSIVEGMKKEQKVFQAYNDSYQKHPEMTVLRLWSEMVKAVLDNQSNNVSYVSPHTDVVELIIEPYLERQKEIDQAAVGKQMRAGGQR